MPQPQKHTYLPKPPNPRPQTKIRQLPPPPRMRNSALVKHATNDIHQHGNKKDDGEDAARPHAARLVGLGARTRVLRAHLEEVGALVRVGADEGEGCGRVGVVVAEEGDCGGFVAEGGLFVFFFLLVLVVFVVFVVVFGAALGFGVLVLLVVVVVVVLVSRALVDAGALVLVGGAAGRAALVLENELAPSRDEVAGLLAAGPSVSSHFPHRGGGTIP